MSTENNLNSELYVNGLVWEKCNGEWQLEVCPVTLDHLCKCIFEGLVLFDMEIRFNVYDAVKENSKGNVFNHTLEYTTVDLPEILDLFSSDEKQNKAFLEGKVILASLNVPYREIEYTQLVVPLPLTTFFDLLRNHYYKPETKIEDIPF